MCSVSFLPTCEGFDLAMNRDEQVTRIPALPPAHFQHGKMTALYPHEPGSGTWVGVNEAGMTFALINWHSQPQRAASEMLSRGKVIPALTATGDSREAERVLCDLPLIRMNPFRLILVSLAEQCLREWRWDGTHLRGTTLPWSRHHWFSSGLNEMEANRVRQLTCEHAARQSVPEPLLWLRHLHQTHYPKKGAFSICMHRTDAQTVSYVEISATWSDATVTMTYQNGPPCLQAPFVTSALRLRVNETFQTATALALCPVPAGAQPV